MGRLPTMYGFLAALAAMMQAGCWGYRDPLAPLDDARREINEIQTCQTQAGLLLPLQDDLQKALRRDPMVRGAAVGLVFGAWDHWPQGAGLVVKYVVLLQLKDTCPPSTQPAIIGPPSSSDANTQDMVRRTFADCGWAVEEANAYSYGNLYKVTGQIRGADKPLMAGAGLDVPPDRPKERK